eukprot:CAMPEP_0195590556 /NCGR_PEP_ID=MMETSP0814-20130614/34203_1 /TAXON_ID=97485 /ORGANISM="Prymnesium parvum, Strain Texoma1" /LENGTH=56 /DNA_ID=CAMNT_0040729595 /DNA_START=1078 /DNA_END=1244 /DNA_ORIENTATION=+
MKERKRRRELVIFAGCACAMAAADCESNERWGSDGRRDGRGGGGVGRTPDHRKTFS